MPSRAVSTDESTLAGMESVAAMAAETVVAMGAEVMAEEAMAAVMVEVMGGEVMAVAAMAGEMAVVAMAAVVRAAVMEAGEMEAVETVAVTVVAEMAEEMVEYRRLRQRSSAHQTSRRSHDSCRCARYCPTRPRAARLAGHGCIPPTSKPAGRRDHTL